MARYQQLGREMQNNFTLAKQAEMNAIIRQIKVNLRIVGFIRKVFEVLYVVPTLVTMLKFDLVKLFGREPKIDGVPVSQLPAAPPQPAEEPPLPPAPEAPASTPTPSAKKSRRNRKG